MANNIVTKIVTWGLSKIDSSAIVKEYHNRGKGKSIDYTRQAVTLHRKEIKDYTNAVVSATDPDNPRLGDWMRFREIMKLDGHLMSCVENRILPVQCAPFKLVDNDGNEAPPEVLRLLERPWRLDMARIICSHTFEGPKLVEMFDLNEYGELKKVSEIPQSNFIPQKGIVLDKEYDTEGTSYKEGIYKNYYFQVGEDWNLGLFSQLATIVLAKKLGLGAWLSYIDKYGVPPIFAITDRMDAKRQKELFEMLENFRMNHFAVLQGNEKIETPQGYNVDAYNTFKSLMSDVADREIEKRIQGSSGLTNEKSFVGAAEVQERILGYRLKVDKLIFQYYFNTEVIPRLIKLSPVYAPLEKYNTFEYDESETLSMKEILDAVKSLSQYFEFDINELVKITGLPITKIKAAIGSTLPEPEEPEPDNKQKKKDKVSGFSLLAPYARTAPPLGGVGLIYAGTWDKAFEELIEQIRQGQLKPENLDKEFILKTYDRLNKAAQNGYGKNYYNDELARKMRQNLLEFAATKTHVQQKEVQLYSDSIEDKKLYESEAKKYLNLQNGTYLDVQTSWAARSAQSTRQWQDFQRDKDIYPRGKVRTMNDSDVRPSHAVLEGYVFDFDAPDAARYIPPFDPRCRCWIEQTREALTDKSPDFERDAQWAVNPKTGEIFNDENSYNQKVESKETRLEIRKQAELTKEYLPYNRVIKAGDNKVYVNDFADLSDLEQNIEAAGKLAKELAKDIYIRHHINIDGHKNPELGIGQINKTADLKTYDGDSKIHNFIRNRIKDAAKQTASIAVLDLSKFNGSEVEILRHIKGSLISGNKGIKEVYVIHNNVVKKYNRSIIYDNPNKYKPVKTIEDAVKRAEAYGFKKVELGKASLEQVNIILEALHKEVLAGGKTTIGTLHLSDGINKKGKGIVAGRYWNGLIKQGKMLEINLKIFDINQYSEIRSFEDRVKTLDKRIEQSQETLKKWESQLGKNKTIDKILKQDIKREKQMISDFEYKKVIYEKKIRNNETSLPENVSNLFKDKKEQIISIVHHEYGHYIDDMMQKSYNRDYKKEISVYGQSDIKEYFAEWYSSYRMAGAKDVPDDLIKIFKEWEQKSKN